MEISILNSDLSCILRVALEDFLCLASLHRLPLDDNYYRQAIPDSLVGVAQKAHLQLLTEWNPKRWREVLPAPLASASPLNSSPLEAPAPQMGHPPLAWHGPCWRLLPPPLLEPLFGNSQLSAPFGENRLHRCPTIDFRTLRRRIMAIDHPLAPYHARKTLSCLLVRAHNT